MTLPAKPPKHAFVPADAAGASEAQLVEAARLGREWAVRALIARCNPRLFRVARGIVASDAEAEDVVQETYVNAFTRLESFEGRARFSTWITRIALNNARMHLRRTRSTEEYDTVTEQENSQVVCFPGQPVEGAENTLGRAQFRELLEAALSELPPDLRLPFVLHEIEGMKLRDIADDIGVNIVTLRTRLFRARRRLRAVLEQQLTGGFESVFPFDGARCAHMADRVMAALPTHSE